MGERENLPAKIAAQELIASTEKRGSLAARGMAAVLANHRQDLRKIKDARYRHAREIYNRLTDDGLASWSGYEEREAPLTEALNTFLELAAEGYGKAYFPLSTLYRGWQSIKADSSQALHFLNLATDWLLDHQHLGDPEIWHDLGAIYLGEDNEQAMYWLHKSAEAGFPPAMWHLCGMYGDEEDWDNALHWQIKAAKTGHENAQHGLEHQHEHADLASRIDEEEIYEWYVWSAEQGHVWAQLFLAEALHCGDLIERDNEQAAHWYLRAATQGEPHAQLQIGKIYLKGRGVAQDVKQAGYWLGKSADQGNAEAQYQWGLYLLDNGGEEEKIFQLIHCAADQNYGPAQNLIASCGGDFVFDVTDEQCAELFGKSLTWYEEHAASGDAELRLELALMHLDGWQAPHRTNRLDGLRLLEEVASEPLVIDCDTGKPSSRNDAQSRACRRLGNELMKFSPNTEDVKTAIHWLEQAVDLGDAVACVDLAELYLRGHQRGNHSREPHSKLVEIDLQAAVHWFERGFELGWSTAAYKLGYEYLVGKHLPQDAQLAEKWLLHAAHAKNGREPAALAGNCSAQLVLGQEYASGVRFRQDADAAIYWLKLSAERHKSTGLKLAEIYLDGKIVPRSFDEAIKWLTHAANGGFRNQAMKLAAERCAGGRFSATEVFATQAWLVEMAAQATKMVSDEKYPAREAINAFDLGELYERGLGIEQDMEHAVTWYTHAAELDNRKAQTRLNELGVDWENT